MNPGMPTDSVHTLDPLDEYRAALRASGRSPRTLHHYRYCVEGLRSWLDRDEPTITRLEVRGYVRWLSERYRPAGVQSRIRALRVSFDWLAAEGMATESLFRGVSVKVPADPRPTATDEQIEWMLAKASRGPANHHDADPEHPGSGPITLTPRSSLRAGGRQSYLLEALPDVTPREGSAL